MLEKLGNNYLGADFSISSSLLLVIVFSFMFYYRKQIFFFLYKKQNLELFIKEVKEYLSETYPNFKFDYTFIHGLKEKNPDAKKYEILDGLINQYTNKPYKAKVNNPYTEKFWDSYAFYSKPEGEKKPKDWAKRELAVTKRDKNICQRCSKKVDTRTSDILFIKEIKDGGTYYLENIVLVCHDCHMIEQQKRENRNEILDLEIKEKLYTFVH